MVRTWIALALALTPCPGVLFANRLPGSANADRATASGRVIDIGGTPLENASVIVFSAGVKNGYSLFCPTCYRDCGKRAVTGSDGTYTINGLDPELLFTFVAVKDGYLAEFVPNVDPAAGPAQDARLKPMPAIKDATQVVRGRVVDTRGIAMRAAVIRPDFATYLGPYGRMNLSYDSINEVIVTNDNGEFEVAFNRPAVEMTLRVAARGMAPKHVTLSSGADRKTIIVEDGAMIRGRLVYNRRPIAGAEVGLNPHDSGVGRWYPEVRIGTAQDGTFTITNVPFGRIWLLHPTMESLASRGIGAGPVVVETKADGQIVDLGDIRLKPEHTFRGKIVLSNGKPIPPDMQVLIVADQSGDTQAAKIAPDGRFRFDALPDGIYTVAPGVQGYRLANECLILCRSVEVIVHQDITDFVIRMQPDSGVEPQK